jgi:hypothetical protein
MKPIRLLAAMATVVFCHHRMQQRRARGIRPVGADNLGSGFGPTNGDQPTEPRPT